MRKRIKTMYMDLQKKMTQCHLAPKNLKADNKRHIYKTTLNGIAKYASYCATLVTLNDNQKEPALICCYGFLNEAQQFNYSSLMNKEF